MEGKCTVNGDRFRWACSRVDFVVSTEKSPRESGHIQRSAEAGLVVVAD